MTPDEKAAIIDRHSIMSPPPADEPITLGPVDAAYVTMIEGEYQVAVQNAQQLRLARFQVVMKAHGIAEGSQVTVVPAENGRPMQLQVSAPPANGAR